MNITIKPTDKEYYTLVNYPELVTRAEELGFEGVSLYTEKEINKALINYASENNKSILRIIYQPEEGRNSGALKLRYLDSDISYYFTIAEYNLYNLEIKKGKTIRSLQDAVLYFPTVKKMENMLRSSGIIKEIDYTGKCGNCHEILGENDKYCRYCGTERGQGKFEPYKNETYCVYGPPIKKKYKCTLCGHIWIGGRRGGEHSRYCLQCGKETIDILEDRALDMVNSAIGFEEPYDIDEKPILFTEDEVSRLLDLRKNNETANSGAAHLTGIEVFDLLRSIGINIPEGATYVTYPKTEKEGEQINLAYVILQTEGNNMYGNTGAKCPYCGSSVSAVIAYSVIGKNYKELAGNVHVPSSKDSLKYNDGGQIYYDDPRQRNANYPAYVCLKCATEFGSLVIPNDVIKVYEMQCEQNKKSDHHYSTESVTSSVGRSVSTTESDTSSIGMSVSESVTHDYESLVYSVSSSTFDTVSVSKSIPNCESSVGTTSATDSTSTGDATEGNKSK